MSQFIGTIQQLIGRIGPWFLHQKNIATLLESAGFTLDTAVQSLQEGLLLANPLQCDESALPVISNDRSIRLFKSEPIDSQRLRLAQWLQLHRGRGNHFGEMEHAKPYFLPNTPVMRIVHQDGLGQRATWHTLAGDGTRSVFDAEPSNWNYDGNTFQFSRWWVIIYVPASLVSGLTHFDDGSKYDGGQLYDGILTEVAQTISNLFLEWHSAHSRLQAIILATDPSSFNPSSSAVIDPSGFSTLPVGNWGAPQTPGPVARYTRLTTALWIYDRGSTP